MGRRRMSDDAECGCCSWGEGRGGVGLVAEADEIAIKYWLYLFLLTVRRVNDYGDIWGSLPTLADDLRR